MHNIRGMSEPLFFSFNVDKETRRLLCHAVIFSSFEVSDESTIHLATPEDDPRMPVFIKYCMDNYGKKAKDALVEELRIRSAEINELEQSLKRIKTEIKQTKQ